MNGQEAVEAIWQVVETHKQPNDARTLRKILGLLRRIRVNGYVYADEKKCELKERVEIFYGDGLVADEPHGYHLLLLAVGKLKIALSQ